MGKVLVHLFFADPEQAGNVPCSQLAFSKDLLVASDVWSGNSPSMSVGMRPFVLDNLLPFHGG